MNKVAVAINPSKDINQKISSEIKEKLIKNFDVKIELTIRIQMLFASLVEIC